MPLSALRCRGPMTALQRAIFSTAKFSIRASTSDKLCLQVSKSSKPSISYGFHRSLSTLPSTTTETKDQAEDFKDSQAVEKTDDRINNKRTNRQLPGVRQMEANIDRLLHEISLNVQRTGRVSSFDLRRTLDIAMKANKLNPNQALLLLRCYGDILVDEHPKHRTKLMLECWKLCEKIGVTLDISHFNALLRAYLENEHDFTPADFLSWMEGQHGVAPNRVTYQLLITRYCQMGDIGGATTILEFMKQKDMSVNESVFHALITGHCRNNDFIAAEGILKLMAESEIDVSSESHVHVLMGMAHAGKTFEEVQARMEAAKADRFEFSQHDIFRMIIEFLKAGNRDAALKMAESLPKTRGYFQELRNATPQMIFAGETELPFNLLEKFQMPLLADQGHANAGKRDSGLFLLRAMVRHDYPLEKVIQVIETSLGGQNADRLKDILTPLVSICIEMGKVEFGSALLQTLKDKYGEDIYHAEKIAADLRFQTKLATTPEEGFQILRSIVELGATPPYSWLSNDFIPMMEAEGDITRPGTFARGILDRASCPKLKFSLIFNATIQHLLNRENIEGLGIVASSMAYVHLPCNPTVWNASLARAYLATGKMDYLMAVLFNCQKRITWTTFTNDNLNEEEEKDSNLFATLIHIHGMASRYRPNEKPDDVIVAILKEMKRYHLGVPDRIAELLKRAMNETWTPLLDEMIELYNNREVHLTKDRIESYLNIFKEKTKNATQSSSLSPNGSLMETRSTEQQVAAMERKWKSSTKKDNLQRLAADLLEAYADNGNMSSAETLATEISEIWPNFTVGPAIIQKVIETFIQQNNLDEVKSFLTDSADTPSSALRKLASKQKFLTSYNIGLEALAKAGRYEDCLAVIGSLDGEASVISRKDMSISILNYYADQKEPAKVEAIYDLLVSRGFKFDRASHFDPIIRAHLSVDDLESAVVAFENLSKASMKVPHKQELMERLIQVEDMERMQRVLDASIAVIGEEKSLYDLAHNFLCLGKTAQARKLLETPGLRYHEAKLKDICERLRSRGQIDALENLVFMTVHLFSCDREFLYGQLVSAVANDMERMSEVWLRMQEEGFVPSDKLKMAMAESFMRNKKSPPFEVPSSAVAEVEASRDRRQKESRKAEEKKEIASDDSKPKASSMDSDGADSTKNKEFKPNPKFEKLRSLLKSNDSPAVAEEMIRLLQSGDFLLPVNLIMVLDSLSKNQAWSEGIHVLNAISARNLDSRISDKKSTTTILENADLETVRRFVTETAEAKPKVWGKRKFLLVCEARGIDTKLAATAPKSEP